MNGQLKWDNERIKEGVNQFLFAMRTFTQPGKLAGLIGLRETDQEHRFRIYPPAGATYGCARTRLIKLGVEKSVVIERQSTFFAEECTAEVISSRR